jgi:NAD(P)-dependent dehydrogenase (short-subunit alcohol dehydrogenase family)
MNIAQSVVLVTGANRGLGFALVEAALAAKAKKVYAAARNPRALDALVARAAGRVVPLQLDVTSAREIEAAAQIAGDVSLLLNNAGVLASYNLLDSSRAQIEQDMAVNFYGTLAVTKAFVPALERAKGAVVNVLTVVSLASRPMIGGYAAAKAAAFSATQALRPELKAKGIDVHAASPARSTPT